MTSYLGASVGKCGGRYVAAVSFFYYIIHYTYSVIGMFYDVLCCLRLLLGWWDAFLTSRHNPTMQVIYRRLQSKSPPQSYQEGDTSFLKR